MHPLTRSDGRQDSKRHYEVTWSDGATVTAVLHTLYCAWGLSSRSRYISPSYVRTSLVHRPIRAERRTAHAHISSHPTCEAARNGGAASTRI